MKDKKVDSKPRRVQTSITLSPITLSKLKAIAQQNRRSVSGQIDVFLADAVSQTNTARG